ncbi:unnamed protein product [Sphagnum jensenii]|uniref:Uncharacterized protein n=1 Tax=Sphagnum jensenii TaxID=128206 RepID=A0ABP1AW45_9BRYO
MEMDWVELFERIQSYMSLNEELECLKKKPHTAEKRWEIFSRRLEFTFVSKINGLQEWNNRSNKWLEERNNRSNNWEEEWNNVPNYVFSDKFRIEFDGAAPDDLSPILQSMAYDNYHNALNVLNKFQRRYPRDPKISQLLEKIKRMSGFLLGVVVLFMYQYSIGYVETGRWNTYSNGAWEFRATYVCIELRLGSYPFQKFRETPRRFGVRPKNKNGVTVKYEPWVWFRKRKIYFEVQKTEDKAARIRDVAKYWLKSEGRDPLNFGEEDYYYLNFVQEFHPQQSDNEHEENHKIRRLVLEHAQRFLKEVQVPIVNQPFAEPARLANGENNTIQGLSAYVDMLEAFLLDDTNEQTADMIEEPQSVSRNPDIAGPTIEENIREHGEALISSAGPSLIESGCTSQITLIAPCDGTGAVNLFTELKLKVFRKEKWTCAVGNFALASCAHEGCSATMHKFVCLRKSGDTQELSWSVEMADKLDDFENHGWKIKL